MNMEQLLNVMPLSSMHLYLAQDDETSEYIYASEFEKEEFYNAQIVSIFPYSRSYVKVVIRV